MQTILLPVALMGSMGIVFALILNFASKAFYVPTEKKVMEVMEALPGANCGACGFPGCEGLAGAIVRGSAPITACPIGGEALVKDLAKIMGQEAVAVERKVAVVKCQGDKARATDKYEFQGRLDCRSMYLLQGGNKTCEYGCLGGGSCQMVCDFGAIELVNGLAIIDKEKCTACGKCVGICPKGIIEMVPYKRESIVLCSSHDKGKDVRGYCKVGCIGCSICARQYPEGFEMDNLLAKATYDVDNFDAEALANAVNKCPNKCITPGDELSKILNPSEEKEEVTAEA